MRSARLWNRGGRGLFLILVVAALALSSQPGICGAPAEVTLLIQSHFVPAYETELKKQVEAWGKQKGVATRVDFVGTAEFNAKLVAEAETRAGHDVVVFRNYDAALYKDSLTDLDAVANDLGNQYGGWLPIARETSA